MPKSTAVGQPARRARRGGLGLAALVGVGGLVFAALGWRAYERSGLVARLIPARPANLAAQSILPASVEGAERSARRYWSAVAGLEQLGRIYHANGFLAEAAQVWEGLGLIEPRNPRWPYLLATILAGYGRLDVALPRLQQTVDLAPDYLPARLRLAEALLKTGRTEEAAQAFAAALAKDPVQPYALLGLVRIDFAARRWPEAREKLQRITTATPDFSPAWALLVTVHEQTGAIAAAEEARGQSTNSGLRMMPDPWIDELMADCYDVYRLNVAAAAMAKADSAGAIRLLRRALIFDPANALSHRLLGTELKKAGDTREARRAYERAAELAPEADLNWTTLVVFLKSNDELEASEAALVRGLVHCPDSPGLLLERVERLTASGRLPESLAILQRLQRLHPTEAEYGVKIALVHFRLGQIPEGLEQMQRTLALKPDHPIALLALAHFVIQSGDRSAARTLIARMRLQPQIKPDDLAVVLEDFRRQFGQNP